MTLYDIGVTLVLPTGAWMEKGTGLTTHLSYRVADRLNVECHHGIPHGSAAPAYA
jgi:hypothetical protein